MLIEVMLKLSADCIGILEAFRDSVLRQILEAKQRIKLSILMELGKWGTIGMATDDRTNDATFPERKLQNFFFLQNVQTEGIN